MFFIFLHELLVIRETAQAADLITAWKILWEGCVAADLITAGQTAGEHISLPQEPTQASSGGHNLPLEELCDNRVRA